MSKFVLLLTLIRIPLGIVIASLIVSNQYLLAACTVVCAGITDLLDGYLAKTYQVVTKTGEWLDPLTDKFYLLCSLTMLVITFQWSWIPFVGILMRDVGITFMREYVYMKGKRLAADRWGKLKTHLQWQLVFLTLVFAHMSLSVYFMHVLYWIVGFYTIFTGFVYLARIKTIRLTE